MFKIALIYSIKTSLHSHNCNFFTPYQDNRTITATLIYKSSPPDTRVYKVTSSSFFFAFLFFRFFLCFSWLLFAVVVRYPTHLFFKWERYYNIHTALNTIGIFLSSLRVRYRTSVCMTQSTKIRSNLYRTGCQRVGGKEQVVELS